MTTTHIAGVLALIIAIGSVPQAAQAQQPGITRTNLQRRDLSIPGREVVQVRVDFAPGAAFPRHSHPGEEIVYAIDGTMEYQLDGQPPATLKAGQVLFIPAGAIHAVKTSARATPRSSPLTSWRKGNRSSCRPNEHYPA